MRVLSAFFLPVFLEQEIDVNGAFGKLLSFGFQILFEQVDAPCLSIKQSEMRLQSGRQRFVLCLGFLARLFERLNAFFRPFFSLEIGVLLR